MKFTQRPIAAAIAARTSGLGLAAAVLAAAIAFTPGQARAESDFTSGAGALSATARLNFQITIPRFLFLQVGTGTSFADNGAIDTILFDMTATPAAIGNGVAQAGTGGTPGPGAVNARVVGNDFGGAATLSATTLGAMSNGAGSTISWSEIAVASPTAITVVPPAASVLNHPGTLTNPFTDGGATTASLTPVGRIINQAALWTFSYKNNNVPAAGTYGGAANNGQVAYTIAMP
jgi:hypothetical protein